jgi:hypothetical protein
MRTAVLIVLSAALGCQTDTTIGSNFLGSVEPPPDAMRLPACADAIDNDNDSLTDYPFDPGCDAPADDSESDPAIPPACSDAADNDGDTVVDFPMEPGCESAADDDETDPTPRPACSDGVDNDGDGNTDYPDDDGCESAGGQTEDKVTS